VAKQNRDQGFFRADAKVAGVENGVPLVLDYESVSRFSEIGENMPKRELVGKVTSDKMQKTRVVEISRKVRHPKYGKFIRQRTVCHVHDEKSESALGDTVRIIESRPLSRTKRWVLAEVVAKSNTVDIAASKAADAEGKV
jgi:small subunit ribosomal protein S17